MWKCSSPTSTSAASGAQPLHRARQPETEEELEAFESKLKTASTAYRRRWRNYLLCALRWCAKPWASELSSSKTTSCAATLWTIRSRPSTRAGSFRISSILSIKRAQLGLGFKIQQILHSGEGSREEPAGSACSVGKDQEKGRRR